MANTHKTHNTESQPSSDTWSKSSEAEMDGRTLSGTSTPRQEKATSPASEQMVDNDSKQIITLTLSDPEHPNNWSKTKKYFVLMAGISTVIHSTLGSSLPSNAVPYIASSFGVTSELQMVLPISTFLMVRDVLLILKNYCI